MKLLSFIPNKDVMNYFDNSWININRFVKSMGLDGVETMIGTYHSPEYLKDGDIHGLHLLYYPTWLDLWYEDEKRLIKSLGSKERMELTFEKCSRDILIDHYKKEFENAKKIGVRYMVFHVSHVGCEEIFTFNHKYNSKKVIEATVELINEVFIGEGPELLFENLFWPGLTLLSNEETKYLLDSVNYRNKGLLLDTSHLICTGREISTYDEGVDYIKEVLEMMGELRGYIRGVHLNASLPSKYLEGDFSVELERWKGATSFEKYKIEMNHIKSIDSHRVFKSNRIDEILEMIPYRYLTLELAYESIEDLKNNVGNQLKYLNKK